MLIDAFGTAVTVNVTALPTNLSLGIEPVNVKVPPGATNPEKTRPCPSEAVTKAGNKIPL
jgi:hypothetical protein